MGRVRMFHPASDRFQDASQAAFDAQWQSEGWVIVDAPEAAEGDGSPVEAKPRARRS
jgi:hypothetical protein